MGTRHREPDAQQFLRLAKDENQCGVDKTSYEFVWPPVEESLYVELSTRLEQRFRAFHAEQTLRTKSSSEIGRMTGVEFENYLMGRLKRHGFVVSGTATTGDQGADIIARINDRVLVIQAKRSKSVVGNKAIQEVVAALKFYSGTEAWVVTNSTFTDAAEHLAQRNGVCLIRGSDLPGLIEILSTPNCADRPIWGNKEGQRSSDQVQGNLFASSEATSSESKLSESEETRPLSEILLSLPGARPEVVEEIQQMVERYRQQKQANPQSPGSDQQN